MDDIENNDSAAVSAEMEKIIGQDQAAHLKCIPALEYFEKMYGRSLQNDQKAMRIFRDYEPQEKLRRLQSELCYVRDNRVPLKTIRNILGRRREEKYTSFNSWAQFMLLWASQGRK